MKKNLRIVSAAAALLAVAPVAATVVPAASTVVKADTTQYGNQIGTLGTTKDLGTIDVTDPNADSVKTNILNQVAAQIGMSSKDIELKGYTVSKTGNTYTATFNVYSPKADGTDWFSPVNINGKDNPGLRWNAGGSAWTNGPTTAAEKDGYLYTQHGKVEYSVTLNKTTKPTASENISGDSNSTLYADANVAVNLSVIAGKNEAGHQLLGKDYYDANVQRGSVSGNIVATLDGKSYTGMISTNKDGENITFVDAAGNTVKASDLRTRTPYDATINSVAFNLGNAYSNKDVTLTLPNGMYFDNGKQSKKLTADVNGVVNTGKITVQSVYALDPTDMKGISFYELKTGNIVNSGSVSLNAVNGKVNIESIYASVLREYSAAQVFNDAGNQDYTARVAFLNDIKSQLEKQNIKVDANGYFTAPASFTINMKAKSQYNGAEATLPVTINVPNATVSNNTAAEETKTVTIMHISTIYDKNGKATHDPALRAYDTYTVVKDPVTLKDEKGNNAGTFYKLAGKDQYIKVGNVDGTSRTLKHNSYVYKSTGKRNGKKVLKKGSSVTTYGKSFMIAGHQMYRIGKNQYVKKANF